MIAHSMNHNWNVSNGVHSMTIVQGPLFKSAFAESGPKQLLPGNPEYAACTSHAMCASSDVFTRYLQGIRRLARKKQRHYISQELG